MAARSRLAQYVFDAIAARGETPEEFARRVGINASGLYKFLRGAYAEPRQSTIDKIAAGLSMTPAELMSATGRGATGDDSDLIEQTIRQRMAEMREAVKGTPRQFWATIVNATFDRAIGGARDMARLLNEAESAPAPISDQNDTAVSNPKTRPNTLRGGDQSHLQKDKDGAAARHRMPLLAVGAAL